MGKPELIGRRSVLAGLLASVPAAAMAGGPLGSVRPRARPVFGPETRVVSGGFDAILAESGLGAMSGFALADVATGRILEGHETGRQLPPASVTKLFTALYALETLGPEHVFETRVLATGPVSGGQVRGDLVLAGGGDPHLDSDQLAEMIRQLRDQGIRGIDGRFFVVGTALPPMREIDAGQPEFVSYNPAISGLNLNFNRAYFEWKYKDGGLDLSMQARAEAHSPEVRSVHVSAENRAAPVFSYRAEGGEDYWSVSAPALAKPGGRWLPVRNPEAYAAEVFRALGRQYGIELPEGEIAASAAPGTILARYRSIPLRKLVRSMLLYSTNLTAEVLGLTATGAKGFRARGLADSGAVMSDWAQARLGLTTGHFVNHSGLSDHCLVSAAEMVAALAAPGSYESLNGLMKKIGAETGTGTALPGVIQAKTGTLNFCRALSGYIDSTSGRRLAYAIFATDLDKRRALAGSEEERPSGSRTFLGKARRQEAALLRRWAAAHG